MKLAGDSLLQFTYHVKVKNGIENAPVNETVLYVFRGEFESLCAVEGYVKTVKKELHLIPMNYKNAKTKKINFFGAPFQEAPPMSYFEDTFSTHAMDTGARSQSY